MGEQKLVGRYEIIRKLGSGGMASVFLALDPQIKREIAIKILPQQLSLTPEFRERFRREAQFVAGLEHPAIVPIYDYGETNEQPYIVMRYMSGGSLDDRLEREGRLALGEAIQIMEKICAALDFAHQAGIIHRDLKPGNILFDESGNPCIADFGIAKLSESKATLTGSALIGTPAYMSPEQALGKARLDGRSDLYALGVIFFELLTGKLPYEADTPMGMALAHVNEPVPNILAIQRDLPAGCEKIISRALAKDRERRFPTGAALVAALKAVEGNKLKAAPGTISMLLPGLARRQSKRREPQTRSGPGYWVLLGLGVILVGLYLIINVLLPNLQPASPATQVAALPGTETAPGLAAGGPSADSTASPIAPTPLRKTLTPSAIPPTSLPSPTFGSSPIPIPAEDTLKAVYVDDAPTIDGVLDEWKVQPILITTVVYDDGNYEGAEDLSATAIISWDDDYLYVGLKITDDRYSQMETGDQIFKGDHVEVLLDADLDGDFAINKLNGDDYQIGLSLGRDLSFPETYLWYPKVIEGNRLNVVLAGSITNDGYILEAAIPWQIFTILPSTGRVFGFALSVSDNDQNNQARQETMISSAPARLLSDPTTWGNLFLTGP